MPRSRTLGIALFSVAVVACSSRPKADWPQFTMPEYCCERLAHGVSLASGSVLWGLARPDTDMVGGPEERWIWRWEYGQPKAIRYPVSLERCPISGIAGPGIDLLRECQWKQEAVRLAGYGEEGDAPSVRLFEGSGGRTILLVRDPYTKIAWSFLVEGGHARRWKEVDGEGPFYEVEIGSDRLVDGRASLPEVEGRLEVRRSLTGRLLGASKQGDLLWCRTLPDGKNSCVSLDTTSGLSQGSGQPPSWVRGGLTEKPRWRLIADALMSSPETAWVRFAGHVVQVLVIDIETGDRCGAWEVSDRIGDSWLGMPHRLPSGEVIAIGRRPTRSGETELGFNWVSFNGAHPGEHRHIVLEDGLEPPAAKD